MLILIITLAFLLPFAVPAAAQSHSWNMHAREASQTATSRALTQMDRGQLDLALASLTEAVQADPQDPLPLSMLGLCQDMKGSYGEALESLHRSWQLDPHSAETAISIGITSYLQHDYDKAINAWHKALDLNARLCGVQAALGFAYLRKGDLGRAEESLRQALRCAPASQLAYQGQALLKYLSGDLDGARAAADQALGIAAYPPLVLMLAGIDQLQGQPRQAARRIVQYETVSRRPGWQRAMAVLGYSAQHNFRWDPFIADDFDNAYLLQARALKLPRQATRQKSLARKGKAEAAMSRTRALLAVAPSDHYLLGQLGLVELSAGQYGDAGAHLKKALEVCPGCRLYARLLTRAQTLEEQTAAVRAK